MELVSGDESITALSHALFGRLMTGGEMRNAIIAADAERQQSLVDALAMIAQTAVLEMYPPMALILGAIAEKGEFVKENEKEALENTKQVIARFVNLVETDNAYAAWPLLNELQALELPDEWAETYLEPVLSRYDQAVDEVVAQRDAEAASNIAETATNIFDSKV